MRVKELSLVVFQGAVSGDQEEFYTQEVHIILTEGCLFLGESIDNGKYYFSLRFDS